MSLKEKIKPMIDTNLHLITTDRMLQTFMVSVFTLLFSIIIYNEYFGDFQNAEECFQLADRMISGDFSYDSLGTDYSPLTLLLLIPPILFSPDAGVYSILFSMYGFAFYMLGGHFMLKSCRETGFPEKDAYILLFLFFICSLSFMTLSTGPFAPAFVIIALWFYHIRNYPISFIALALATMTGFYPVILFAIFLFLLARKKELGSATIGIALYIIICAALLFFPSWSGDVPYLDLHSCMVDCAYVEPLRGIIGIEPAYWAAATLVPAAIILVAIIMRNDVKHGMVWAAAPFEVALLILLALSPAYSVMYYIWIAMLFPMTQMISEGTVWRRPLYGLLAAFSALTLVRDQLLDCGDAGYECAGLALMVLALTMAVILFIQISGLSKKET